MCTIGFPGVGSLLGPRKHFLVGARCGRRLKPFTLTLTQNGPETRPCLVLFSLFSDSRPVTTLRSLPDHSANITIVSLHTGFSIGGEAERPMYEIPRLTDASKITGLCKADSTKLQYREAILYESGSPEANDFLLMRRK